MVRLHHPKNKYERLVINDKKKYKEERAERVQRRLLKESYKIEEAENELRATDS